LVLLCLEFLALVGRHLLWSFLRIAMVYLIAPRVEDVLFLGSVFRGHVIAVMSYAG
jgi:hypothetical protein